MMFSFASHILFSNKGKVQISLGGEILLKFSAFKEWFRCRCLNFIQFLASHNTMLACSELQSVHKLHLSAADFLVSN